MAWRRVTRAALGAVMIIGVLLMLAAPASAHSDAVRSDPPNGGMVPEGRTSLTLWFDEPIGYAASTFEVRTLDGLEVESSVDFPNGADNIVIQTEPLARGQYVIDWHALSLVDGHASSGTIVFGAGLRPDVVAAEGTGPPAAELLVLRWIDLGALLLALGSLTVSGRVLRAAGAGGDRIRAGVRTIGAIAAVAIVYVGLVTPLLRTRGPGGFSSGSLDQTWLTLTETGWGQLWLLRELVLVVAAVAMLRWRRLRGGSPLLERVALSALVAAVILQSLGGHAASLPTWSTVDAVMGAGHVLAAGVWVGGLAVLTIIVVPVMRRDEAGEVPARAAVWRAYSPMAAVASLVLLATGLYQAGQHVPDVESLGSTVYGNAIAAKTLLVLVALALAAVNTVWVHRTVAPWAARLVQQRSSTATTLNLTRTLTAEAGVLGITVLLAAVLTSVPTAREVAVSTRPTAPSVARVDGLFMTLEPVREGAGRYRLILRVRSTVQPEPAPITGVDVQVSGRSGKSELVALDAVQLATDGSEDARFEGRTRAPLDGGAWRGAVHVHRVGLLDATMTADWTVAAPAAESAGPLRVVATGGAAILFATLGAAVLLIRRRSTPASASAQRPPILQRSSR